MPPTFNPAEKQAKQSHKTSVEDKLKYLEVINEFAVQISSLNDVDDILWMIAKHVIAKFDFEDCVIYLVNQEEGHLYQHSAFGPKNPVGFEILDPIKIPIGQGIVGTVAETGRPELILDTTQDERYIVDDEIRLSEISVPIMHEGDVIGVIDSEHSEAAFFQPFHLEILGTLASLVAPRIAFIRDMQEALFQSEAKLRRKNAELAKTVSRLKHTKRELLDARDMARNASMAKSVFIYRMSHELRTPLNAIIGYSELLLEELGEQGGQEEALVDVYRIGTSGQHLLRLINDILDISKIEANQMVVRQSKRSINNLITELASTIQPLVRNNQNQLRLSFLQKDQEIETDTHKLTQVLLNLLGNACKFTDQGSILLAAAITDDYGKQMAEFVVEDTGMGMSAEFLDNLFEPFQQEENVVNQRGTGSGLGLAISQSLVQVLGGEISVASEVGVGTQFMVRIPLSP